jgi:glycerol kinase
MCPLPYAAPHPGCSSMDEPKHYIGALDQGTTSTRFILFRAADACPIATHQLEHTQHRPKAGWVEHDPLEILERAKECIDGCMEKAAADHGVKPADVRAIGITNQRETTIVWDRNTGKPLYNAIVWLDTRTKDTCEKLEASGSLTSDRTKAVTGLPVSSYFSGVKLHWLRENVPAVRAGIDDGSALFGTVDTWLAWCLTEEKAHVTDVTNAGRTLLMNIRTLQWDDEMIRALGISRAMLPDIRSSSEIVGKLSCTALVGLPLASLVGDQQAALIGQSAFNPGEGKSTYGTGCFLIVNTGVKPKFSNAGLLTTPAYKLGPEAPCVYSLEGSIAIAGAAVSWLKDNLELISSSSEIESLAASVEDTGDVYFVPALSGLFAPRWREDARGCIVGLTQFTTRAHIARATLEGIAFQVYEVLRAVEEDLGEPLKELRVDGGASVNNLLMQMQADILGSSVVRPKVIETTALGAAFAAGLAVGVYKSHDEISKCWKTDKKFVPKCDNAQRETMLRKWESAVERSLGWINHS